jgi:GTP-binding protein Era
MENAKAHRAGMVAIVGRPNVGKSTLLNRLLGQKLAAVTPKPQTTRERILGVLNRPDAQIAFVDTPGVHATRGGRLGRYMLDEAIVAVEQADAILLLCEAPRSGKGGAETKMDERRAREWVHEALSEGKVVLDRALAARRRLVVALNKVDRLKDKGLLLPLLAAWAEEGKATAVVPISALNGQNTDALLEELIKLLPEGPALYPEEMLTDRTERFLSAELIREQVFLLTHEEIPYGIAVTIESFEERPGDTGERRDVVIEAVIHVERDSQKAIVVGKGGQMVKQIGMTARAAIAEVTDCPVHLKLFVRVDRDWSQDPAALRRFGYAARSEEERG